MSTKDTAVILLLLFLSLVPCSAEPVQPQDISPTSPWAAHLDFTKLNDPALDGFLRQVTGFDRVLDLQTVLKEQLAIDWASVDGITLSGAGERLTDTSVVLRGDFKKADLRSLPIVNELAAHHGIPLRKGPKWQGTPLILARSSDQKWVAGTSLQAVKDSLDLLAGRKEFIRPKPLPTVPANELKSAAAMFSLDMKKLNTELQFEADFTRAIQRAWFLIGSRNDLVEATVMIDSTDAEGLVFLKNQLPLLTAFVMSQPDPPAVWLELVSTMKVETQGNWMTLKIAASPEKAAVFLKSLAPLFSNTPESPQRGN